MSNGPHDGDGQKDRVQYPLPFGGAKESSEFLDVLAALEAGTLTPEQAQGRVMAIYQMGLGGWIRALGETRPELIPTMIERLRVDLAHISDRYDSAPRSLANVNRPSTEPRLKSKTDDTLRRERIILEAVLKTDQPLASNVLHKLVTDAEPGVKVATLTANLDRMTKAGALVRPRKGYYSSDSSSRSYLQSLESEIEARGIG